ncbi:Hydrolase (HAD superfamily) in cluster with DUF1447 [Lachnospiraceae bacterium TWA4]|nr:Hydrolase (HAD superfamily) in cluster with DUF1447 [Lachnospiraceae bacterium TWA4]
MNREYKAKKAVFFDIDGTLYDRQDPRLVPESAKKAIQLLQKNGHLAIICTGRCDCMVEEYLRNLQFDGYIFGCGTNLVFNNEELVYEKLPTDKIKRLMNICKKHEAVPIFEGKYELYVPDEKTSIDGGLVYRFYSQFIKLSPLVDEQIEVSKMMARMMNRTPKTLEAFYKDLEDEGMQIFDHGDALEMVEKGYGKDAGIERLINELGIKKENTIAFGDSPNDLSMLDYVETGIAMGNAKEEVLDSCIYKTDAVYEDGIYRACEKLGLFK